MARGHVIVTVPNVIDGKGQTVVALWDNASADALDALDALELGGRVLEQLEAENA